MRVLAYSTNLHKKDEIGWHRVGSDIKYYQNTMKNKAGGNMFPNRRYYTLSFTHEFKSDDDQVYFTHCFPYNYSDLCDDILSIEK
jgi:hypothetical protein